MGNAILYSKLASLPENLKVEVSDFIDYLLNKSMKDEKNAPVAKPKFGSAKGMFKMKADFDDSLDDFSTYSNVIER